MVELWYTISHYCVVDVNRPRISDVSLVSLFRSPLGGTVRSEWINKFQRGLKEGRDIDDFSSVKSKIFSDSKSLFEGKFS